MSGHWTTLETEKVKQLLDMIGSSMDFGSGFLETSDIELLREIAQLVGSDPWKFTPHDSLDTFCEREGGHQWGEYEKDGRRVNYAIRSCAICGKGETDYAMIQALHAKRRPRVIPPNEDERRRREYPDFTHD